MKFYTGVGSRSTPDNVLMLMNDIAMKMNDLNIYLRSGGAKGADSAFETGAVNKKKIYYAKDCTEASKNIAMQFHPVWERLSDYAKKLHGRNSFQVLGDDLQTPSIGLICWTQDGCCSHKSRTSKTGGTGTAISIADSFGVKINNLKDEAVYNKWKCWVNKVTQEVQHSW